MTRERQSRQQSRRRGSERRAPHTAGPAQPGQGKEYVGRFLTAIASLPRIVTPVDLDMAVSPRQSNREEDAEEKTPVLAQFQIQTYVIPPATAETEG